MVKLSRRELTLGAAAAALVPQVKAQNAAQSSDPGRQALEIYRRNAETLKKFEIPMDTEPAFQFKP